MSDHWRKIMSLGGVEGAAPEDVSRRLDAALAALEREREAIAKVLHELERSNKGADVMAAEVKRLKVQKLRLKDDARARAQGDAVCGGGAASRRGLLRVRIPGPRRRRRRRRRSQGGGRAPRGRRASVEGSRSPSIDACQMAGVERLMKRDPNEKRSFEEDPENPRDGDVVTLFL